MDSFWDNSWEHIDPARIAEYINAFDMSEDDIISMLRQYDAKSVCDAGCGCGIYALKLAKFGFAVGGFDVSAHAAAIAQAVTGNDAFKTASILATGYADGEFDAVIARDVIDHVSKLEAKAAIKELCRITKPTGIILITLDATDQEYEDEPHTVTQDGDYVFTDGKWNGMVFHPYCQDEVYELIPDGMTYEISEGYDSMTILLKKVTQ